MAWQDENEREQSPRGCGESRQTPDGASARFKHWQNSKVVQFLCVSLLNTNAALSSASMRYRGVTEANEADGRVEGSALREGADFTLNCWKYAGGMHSAL